MTPQQAFDDVMNRARRLMRLHDGLINTRQRSIRNDWRQSFCRLMHWPLNTPIERVDSVDAIVVLREGAALQVGDFAQDTMDDLLRSAHVFVVSALDRYVHERVCKGIIASYKNSELLKEQQEFAIPLKLAIEAAEALRRAQREGRQVRPANEFRKAIQELLHRRPFQSWRDIEYAFKLIGISGLAGAIQQRKGLPDVKEYKAELGRIVDRRHRIVHEGDLPRHQRGGQALKAPISPKFVNDSITFIEDFVDQLEQI